ncbi:MAG: NAD(P)-dependent oxidoreductase [Phycisphaerae bacterium]
MIPLAILAADRNLNAPANLETIPDAYDVKAVPDWHGLSDAELLDLCRSAEVVVTGRRSPRLPQALIDEVGRLRWVCHLYGTVRHLVRREHIEAGITVTNWGDSQRPVAEGTVALLLAQLRQIVALDRYCRTGVDERAWQDYNPNLRNLRVGLYGFGPIGRQVGEMLHALQAKLAIYDPYAEEVWEGVEVCDSLEELFDTSQAVCVLCGLNRQTENSVTRELMLRLPQGGVLINTARGPIVDEEAAAELAGEGRIIVGADVICDEGDWPSSPLAKVPNTALTHHVVGPGKGYTPGREPIRPLPEYVTENLQRYLDGRDLTYTISPEQYDLKT